MLEVLNTGLAGGGALLTAGAGHLFMKRDFSRVFNTLLDTSGGLGVGMVDANGLAVHVAGSHDGLDSAEVGAHLQALRRYPLKGLEQALGDEIRELVVIGRRHAFYLLSFEDLPYLLYVMTPKDVSGGRSRAALAQARETLSLILRGQGLLSAGRKRLEQPRQFRGPRPARKRG